MSSSTSFAIPTVVDCASSIPCDDSDNGVGVIHAATRTQCLGDDSGLIVLISSARSVESDRNRCYFDSCRQSSDSLSHSLPTSDFAYWNEKISRSSDAFTLLESTDVSISWSGHCAPVFLKIPHIVFKATAAWFVSIAFSKRCDIVVCLAWAVQALLLWNSNSRPSYTFLESNGSL